MLEVSSVTIVTGASDDLIEISGELTEEFNCYDCSDGVMAFSNGTLLRVDYDKDGIWIFKPRFKGILFNFIRDASVSEDTNDEVYFKDGLKWITFSDEMQTVS